MNLTHSKVNVDLYSSSQETHLQSAQVWCVCELGITHFYLAPIRLSTSGINQPQSVSALWPVLIFRQTDGRRRS